MVDTNNCILESFVGYSGKELTPNKHPNKKMQIEWAKKLGEFIKDALKKLKDKLKKMMNELKDMVKAIRNIEQAMGDGIKLPMPSELKNRSIIRKSLVASIEIKKGDFIVP